MPDLDHWGKIGCHFPARANPNADVWNIEFLPKGGSSTSVIDRVYMVPDGVTISSVAELQHYIVWTTDVTLVPESDAVCLEFVPPYDIELSNVAIFCEANESSTSVNFAVYHESGLVVAKNNGDTVTQNVTKFGTTGQRRVTAVSGVTLKKGLKYYVQYTNQSSTFKPVVMDGWYGNYKIFSHGQVQNKNVANLNNAGAWIGIIDNTMGIFNYNPGDFFMWQSSGWTPGMQNGHIYMRSTVGANMQFSGVVGNPSSASNITASDLTNFLGKPLNSAFLWYVTGYSSMSTGTIWQKTTSTADVNLFDFDGMDNDTFMVNILIELQTKSAVMASAGSLWYKYPSSIGDSFELKSQYHNRVTSTTPIALPDDLVEGDIIYLQGGHYYGNWYNQHLYLYTGGTLKEICNVTTDSSHIYYTEVFDMYDLTEYLTYVGVNSDLTSSQYGGAEWDNSYQSDGFRTSTLYTDKKHYLEINGTEV